MYQITEHHDCRKAQQRKNIEADVALKRKSAANARVVLKGKREGKQKADMPVFSNFKNIWLEFGISAAAYHGRKLNGVD